MSAPALHKFHPKSVVSILFHACLKSLALLRSVKGKWSESLQLMLGFKDLFIKLEMLCIYSLILPFSEFTLTMVCLASSATEKDQEHFSQPSRCIMQTASDTCCPGNWSFKTHINRVLMAEL